MRSIRILHCLRAPVGGLFRHVRDLALEQARRGHAVGLIYDARASDPLTDARLQALAPHLMLGFAKADMPREIGAADVGAVGTVRRLAGAMQVDVLHGHGAKGGAYARLAAAASRRRGRSVACFYTPHGGSLHYSPDTLKGRLFMSAERYLARFTDGVIFESAYAARVYGRHVGTVGCPTRIIHNGITACELEPVEPAADAADFVFVGELRLLKGVDLLIEATAEVLKSRPCRVVIVGAGPDGEQFRRSVSARGLDDAIRFAGAMPAREAFRLGQALVMPSRAESLPYVALEAAGAGLPLIATAVGGVPEIVAGSDTPLIAPGHAAPLAEAMLRLLSAPADARAQADRLHASIAADFSVTTMTDGVLDLYETALARRPTVEPSLHVALQRPAA